MSRGSSSTTSTTPRVTRLVTQARRRLLHLRRASGCLGTLRGLSWTTSTTPRVWVPRHVARLVAQARHRLLLLSRASGCLGTSRGSSRDSSHCSSSTTSPLPRVWVPRHVARLVTWLVVDYFDYAARPGASACRAARHATRRATRRRLLCLRRTSGCLSTSRGLSHGSSSTTSTMTLVWLLRHVAPLIIDYFDYAARPGASARRAAPRAGSSRLLRLRCTSRCLGTSRDLSHGSSSTTSPMLRVWFA
jgi:hypothetical protein